MRTIDLHAHFTPEVFTGAKTAGRSIHGVRTDDIETGNKRALGLPERLAQMDATGVDVQVLSASPQMYGYEFEVAQTIAIHRDTNDEAHQATRDHPDRFAALAMLPMQDVDAAIAELERAVRDLGMKGAMIGDHVNGRTYDEPGFEPLWAAAEGLGALLLLHQGSGSTRVRSTEAMRSRLVESRIDRYGLANTVGNPVERTLSFAALVFGGVMDRHPDLQICLAHGGGYVCLGIGRMDWGWRWRPEARLHISRPPSAYLDRFYYDSIIHSEAGLRFVIDSVGIERVVFGTDFPGYASGGAGGAYQPVDWIRGLASLTDEEKDAILGGNAERLLQL